MDEDSYKTLEGFNKNLQEKGMKALDELYLLHKEEFFNFCRTYKIDEIRISDIYQDAIIAFYDNVVSGKLETLKSSVKTYIFSIGKYSIYNLAKKDKKKTVFDDSHVKMLDLDALRQSQESSDKVKSIREALKNIGERCRTILILFYYHSYSIEALMHEMDYKNENVVRSHKSRCLKTLREMINEEN